ncbi:unnamed protein product [Brassica rapa]|uniref:Uncharacterized protein n=2 Tax=Brassica TaxID=3705 RepID=A0A8D9CP54_BRACM|nr:unnamed protein product [Brassica napus]CAG7861216.1 unnamed protein product [Brassica rapa]CDY45376.1 BnaA09g12610D [Brassica napus]
MAVEKLNTTVDGVEILKPRTDNREYRKIVLKNSLQVLLISDPDTNKCAASMSVSIRSFSDPQGLEGLAHLPATVNVASSPHSGTVSRLDGDDNDRDDMHGTISVLTKGGVCFNDHEESSPARTTASGLATKKLRVLATPKVVKKARNAYLESVFSI